MPGPAHISIPPRLTRGPGGRVTFATVQQDTTGQVADCVEIIVRTRQGTRALLPDFGRPDLEWAADPETVASMLQDTVDTWERRLPVDVEISDEQPADGRYATVDPDNPGVVVVRVTPLEPGQDSDEEGL